MRPESLARPRSPSAAACVPRDCAEVRLVSFTFLLLRIAYSRILSWPRVCSSDSLCCALELNFRGVHVHAPQHLAEQPA